MGRMVQGMIISKRRALLLLVDCLIFSATYAFFALFTQGYQVTRILDVGQQALHCGVLLLAVFGARLAFGMYGQVWRYANTTEFLRLVLADFIGGCLYLLVDRLLMATHMMTAVAVAVTCLSLLGSLSARFIYQRIRYLQNLRENVGAIKKINIAVVGAGMLGVSLVKELQSDPYTRYKPYCFIDADAAKVGSIISGLKVYRQTEDVIAQFQQLPVQEIVIAVARLKPEELHDMFKLYEQTGCKVKLYAHPLEDTQSQDGKWKIRDVHIEDLLFRETIQFNDNDIQPFYEGKTILITGGGGSIGSELCRQAAKMKPAQLVLVDIYENSTHDICQELHRTYGKELSVRIEIASIRDARKMHAIMQYYKPSIVFHAAAHKHVHLMEYCCDEAVKNNVFGTYNVMEAAEQADVEHFIMISTDKAVNPTNMMGATKRLCEMMVQSKKESKTRFAAVRFGNVLGSNGSIIPLFKKQIENGGPITITDKRIIRYFMTIQEAAQLVTQAGAMAERSEIFVLDMGKPVRILDLAESMIRLAGFRPYIDIDIVEIGLRPGEKLYEELLMKTEKMTRTKNKKIYIERDQSLSPVEVDIKLEKLKVALESDDKDHLRKAMMQIVPTYCDAEEVNQNACRAQEMRQANVIAVG